jgi:hypothetical protein
MQATDTQENHEIPPAAAAKHQWGARDVLQLRDQRQVVREVHHVAHLPEHDDGEVVAGTLPGRHAERDGRVVVADHLQGAVTPHVPHLGVCSILASYRHPGMPRISTKFKVGSKSEASSHGPSGSRAPRHNKQTP